jgi:hypothetical protein
MATVRVLVLASLVGLSAAACDGGVSKRPKVTDVDRVVVLGSYGNDTLSEIDDRVKIGAVLDFINAHRTGWEFHLDGTEAAPVRVALFTHATDAQPAGYFGAGRRFFTATPPTGWAVRKASTAEVAEFTHLIGAPDIP